VSIADDTLAAWYTDGQVSAVRATDPVTGATLATYVTVPAHPVTINGQARKVLGPDYFGPLRDDLEEELGGTVIAGPATLGRQEPPVQTTDYRQLGFYARVLTNLVTQALSTAHPVIDPTLASSETMLSVPGPTRPSYAWSAPGASPSCCGRRSRGARRCSWRTARSPRRTWWGTRSGHR